MKNWTQRFRIALLLSPAFLLVHTWQIMLSPVSPSHPLGIWGLLGMAFASSVVEAYVVVLALDAGLRWSKDS